MRTIDPKDFLIIDESKGINNEFVRIADEITNRIDIGINNNLFALYDFEFYYHSDNHKDGYALKHNTPLGYLRMHEYGIDISLGFMNTNLYGGILLRGAWLKTSENNLIPQNKSSLEISMFNSLTLGNNAIFYYKREKHSTYQTFQTIRKNLGAVNPILNKTATMSEAKYRFIIKDKIVMSYLKGKEKLLTHSTIDRTEWKLLLGYDLNL